MIELKAARIGSDGQWARDLAIVGGMTSFLTPALLIGTGLGWSYLCATALAGASLGAGVGWWCARLLSDRLAQLPIWSLLLLAPILGGFWGCLTGAFAALWATAPGLVGVSALVAAVAAAFQFTWFWLPYLLLRHAGRSVLPLIIGACCLPLLGYFALLGLV